MTQQVRFGSLADGHVSRRDVRFAPTSRHPNSLLAELVFPVCNTKFPVPTAGNSSKEVLCFDGFVPAGRGVSTEIPCIFPRSGNLARSLFAAASQHSHTKAPEQAEAFERADRLPLARARREAKAWSQGSTKDFVRHVLESWVPRNMSIGASGVDWRMPGLGERPFSGCASL